MQVVIVFTKPLQFVEERGWKVGDVGVVFPVDIIDFIKYCGKRIGKKHSIVLLQPTQMKFENEVVTLLWESPEKTIITSIHRNLIASLTMQWS